MPSKVRFKNMRSGIGNKAPRGLCLISIPKSGTMFLSRYLERSSGIPVVFGLDAQTEAQLMHGLVKGWHPDIQAALMPNSHDIKIMVRRFAQMLARNRQQQSYDSGMRILSDHGYHNFLAFLSNPCVEQIQEPRSLVAQAQHLELAPVFLYRDIRAIANSLVHFLVAKKSFLLSISSLEAATDLVTRLYAPILAEQTARWRSLNSDPALLSVSYEQLIADPAYWISRICAHAGLPCEAMDAARAPENYRSWTFRSKAASWHDTFSTSQQATLNHLAVKLRDEQ